MFFLRKHSTFHHLLFTCLACFTFSSLLIKGMIFTHKLFTCRGDANAPTVGIRQKADRNRDEDKSKRHNSNFHLDDISVNVKLNSICNTIHIFTFQV